MAKLIVARGVIHQGTEVVARQGEEYTAKNAAEEKRLLARGVLVPQGNGPEEEPDDPERPKQPASSGRGGKKASGDEGGGA